MKKWLLKIEDPNKPLNVETFDTNIELMDRLWDLRFIHWDKKRSIKVFDPNTEETLDGGDLIDLEYDLRLEDLSWEFDNIGFSFSIDLDAIVCERYSHSYYVTERIHVCLDTGDYSYGKLVEIDGKEYLTENTVTLDVHDLICKLIDLVRRTK